MFKQQSLLFSNSNKICFTYTIIKIKLGWNKTFGTDKKRIPVSELFWCINCHNLNVESYFLKYFTIFISSNSKFMRFIRKGSKLQNLNW
jgi:hypothetical protein